MADKKHLLDDALATITNKHATTKMSNIAIRVIRKSVLPLVGIALSVSRTYANAVVHVLVETIPTAEKKSTGRR